MKINIESLAQENPLFLAEEPGDDYALRGAYLDVMAKEIEQALAAQGATRACEEMSRVRTTKVFSKEGAGNAFIICSYQKNPDEYHIEFKGDEGMEAIINASLNKRFDFVERHTTF
jgi:hypothetical protein